MIIRLIGTICFFITLSTQAQYYYKDIVTPQQTMERLKKYQQQKVRNVKVMSYESTGEATPDFFGSQTITANYTNIVTHFNTALSGESDLITVFNSSGQLVKTVDTTDGSGSVSDYSYNEQGKISKIVNVSTSPGAHQEKEEHHWFYNAAGQPEKMWRIKNETDTTFVTFVTDEKGNLAEENSIRKRVPLPSFYYYYDDLKRLTDIVAYSQKAQRLLPVYIFEYNQTGALASMMVVPEGSDEYQKWYYTYNAGGLKTKETCYNKRKQVMGKIEYVYE